MKYIFRGLTILEYDPNKVNDNTHMRIIVINSIIELGYNLNREFEAHVLEHMHDQQLVDMLEELARLDELQDIKYTIKHSN